MKKSFATLASGLLAVAALSLATGHASAASRVDWSVSVGAPGYYAPAPAYAPAYGAYGAPPVVYAPEYGYESWRMQQWRRHQWRERQWRERQWREQQWREQQWRESMWRRHHGYGY